MAAAIVVIWAYFEIQTPSFLTPRNLDNLLSQMAVIGTVAIGVVLVLLIAEIDLSIGSVVGLSSAVLGVLVARNGIQWWIAIIVALLVAAAVGALQGAWFALLGIPAFVVTLAGLLGWLGVQLEVLGALGSTDIQDPHILAIATSHLPSAAGWVLAAVVIAGLGATTVRSRQRRKQAKLDTGPVLPAIVRVAVLGGGLVVAVAVLNRWQGVSSAGIILVGLVAVFAWVVTRTQFGRHILAIGGSVEAARRAGINVARVRIEVLMLSALVAGIGGVLSVSREGAATTLTGGGTLLLEAIAAAVIGGTSLFGGRGTVWSALTGALIMASLTNGLDLTGQSANVKYIVEMVVLLLAVGLDAFIRRRVKSSVR